MTNNMQNWDEDQEWERKWWGNCVNTMAEESKQIVYAHRMGLINEPWEGQWPSYDLQGKNVLDIGGGPISLLLKCRNLGDQCDVVDPCDYPDWIMHRYEAHNVGFYSIPGEDLMLEDDEKPYDEAWIYNVLQHTQDPALIISNAFECAKTIRIFEWVDIPAHQGHPQELKEDKLNLWLSGKGTVEDMRQNPVNGCNAIAYYGVFEGPVL